ncbi:MAG: amino acid adenylation domain-containing protein [Candidatus Hydrogenedentes bacterium]|nr:amino acid adenylation domain-containing protein [Candidatus Hydrogenedentota bacterium]
MIPMINEVGEYFISHPSVAEVCVLPRHEQAGGLVAFVVLAPGAKTKREKLAAYAAERFPGIAPAMSVVLLPEIPRSRTGSVDRMALMDAFDTGGQNVA